MHPHTQALRTCTILFYSCSLLSRFVWKKTANHFIHYNLHYNWLLMMSHKSVLFIVDCLCVSSNVRVRELNSVCTISRSLFSEQEDPKKRKNEMNKKNNL